MCTRSVEGAYRGLWSPIFSTPANRARCRYDAYVSNLKGAVAYPGFNLGRLQFSKQARETTQHDSGRPAFPLSLAQGSLV